MQATAYRQAMLSEADGKRKAALGAHEEGSLGLRDAFLRQAADRYRAAGRPDLGVWCERQIGT